MQPILYTFRRCPYAIRARLAIQISAIDVELREVALRNKPQALLDVSPKGTVPVLQLPDGSVLEESLDIMRWALARNDPQAWLRDCPALCAAMRSLIETNDGEFKQQLDRYKYADRSPEQKAEYSAGYYRTQGEMFLATLNNRLTQHAYLLDDRISLADMAILPFVRQFAHVDRVWFYASPYRELLHWLTDLLDTPLFASVMKK